MGKKALKTKSSQNGAKNTENVSNDILLALPYLLPIGFNFFCKSEKESMKMFRLFNMPIKL